MFVETHDPRYEEGRENVNYPDFSRCTYFSTTTGRETHMNILLPDHYDQERKYPVLYLLHGFFDNEEWMARREVSLSRILTNLQLDGHAKEMIVVLPYIYCSTDQDICTGMDLKSCLAYDNFINELVNDLMPYVESHFPVATGRQNTAISGFSMGGREALFISFRRPDLFTYVGACCPAPGLVKIEHSQMHPGQIKPEEMKYPEEYKPKTLLISSSRADDVVTTAPDTYRRILVNNGVSFISHVMTYPGHDFTSLKPHLFNFLRLVFK